MQNTVTKLTVLKKKIDIDKVQKRHGPANHVNAPHLSQLYFKTNVGKLMLGIMGQDDSDRRGSVDDLELDGEAESSSEESGESDQMAAGQ